MNLESKEKHQSVQETYRLNTNDSNRDRIKYYLRPDESLYGNVNVCLINDRHLPYEHSSHSTMEYFSGIVQDFDNVAYFEQRNNISQFFYVKLLMVVT